MAELPGGSQGQIEDAFEAVELAFDRRKGRSVLSADGRLSLGVAVLGVAVVAAVAVVLIITLQGARSGAIDAARAATSNLARVLSDNAARSMESVDVALTSVAEAAAPAVIAKEGISPDIDRLIRDRLSYTPVLRQIVVTDADGGVLYDSARQAQGATLSLEPYLSGEEATRRVLSVGEVETRRFIGGRITGGQQLIPVARRIERADGRRVGMVLGAVNPLHFLMVYSLLDLGPNGWVALYRFDGRPLSGGNGGPVSPDIAAALSRREEAGVRLAVMGDGVERIVGYRATPVWPLVLEVGIAKETALAGWRQYAMDLGAPVGGIALLVLGLTAALTRAMQRRNHDQAVMLLSDRALRSVRSGVAIADLSRPGRPLIYVNPAMADITGTSREQLLGDAGVPVSAPAVGGVHDGPGMLRDAVMNLSSEQQKTAVRRPFRRGERMIWADAMLSRVALGEPASPYAVLVINDVSDQVNAEQELLRSLEELAQLHDEQSRFSEILAHHMQEPVRRIVAHCQLLKRALPPLSDDAETAMQVLEKSGRRLKFLLRDVEMYLSAGTHLRVLGAASADVALVTVLNRVRRRVEEAGGQVLRNPLPMVGMALNPLTEVLYALVDNALTHRSPERPPVISIDATPHGQEWVICVEDNGVGIERAYYDRIFRVFERLSNDDAHAGTGIGLALARKLTERASGRIWVESEPGLGSRFFIALPFAGDGRPDGREEEKAEATVAAAPIP
jgi:two-component system, chemotaxis family, sensor kinase Cph1